MAREMGHRGAAGRLAKMTLATQRGSAAGRPCWHKASERTQAASITETVRPVALPMGEPGSVAVIEGDIDET
jgi:hypothetical protein